jgi:EAL domain-containing protein (putative c-di-GMP-specific phosphodiesterase class I)/FixJ family two-component response regulator
MDDDLSFSELLRDISLSVCSDIEIFTDPLLLIDTLFSSSDIIILDIKMPKMDGVEILRRLAIKKCKAKIILISGFDSSVLHSSSMLANELGLNVVAQVTKPVQPKQIQSVILSVFAEENNDLKSNKANSSITKYSLFTKKDIQNAISNNQLILFYQPQIELKTNKLIGLEALVRWNHPEYGIIYPNDFIPLIDKYQLFEELTNKVIRIAIDQEKALKDYGYSIVISINISSCNVTSLTLPETLEELIDNAELEPSMLCFEVTESELMGELIPSIDTLTRMRIKGFKLSIDDFGTGYSSLLQLYRIPFHELKIDQSFIKNLMTSPESKIIVDTCITLSHNLGMIVVAEGIEDQETLEELTRMGCDIGQGYHLCKPMDISSILCWIQKKSKVGHIKAVQAFN